MAPDGAMKGISLGRPQAGRAGDDVKLTETMDVRLAVEHTKAILES